MSASGWFIFGGLSLGGSYATDDPLLRGGLRAVGIVGLILGILDSLAPKKPPGSGTASGAGIGNQVAESVFGPFDAGTYGETGLPEGTVPTVATGIQVGKTAVSAAWVIPQDGGSISRNPFSSKIDVELELACHDSVDAHDVFLEVECQVFRTFASNTKNLTPLGSFRLQPNEVRRVKALVETGDVNSILFETGAGSASLVAILNGIASNGITVSVS